MERQVLTNIGHTLLAATERTFSDMAFVDVTELEQPPEDTRYGQVLHIAFTLPVNGQMILYLPTPCKKLLVENIYSRNWEELKTSEIDDCLLELLNVLAGNFLHENHR